MSEPRQPSPEDQIEHDRIIVQGFEDVFTADDLIRLYRLKLEGELNTTELRTAYGSAIEYFLGYGAGYAEYLLEQAGFTDVDLWSSEDETNLNRHRLGFEPEHELTLPLENENLDQPEINLINTRKLLINLALASMSRKLNPSESVLYELAWRSVEDAGEDPETFVSMAYEAGYEPDSITSESDVPIRKKVAELTARRDELIVKRTSGVIAKDEIHELEVINEELIFYTNY